MKLEIVLTACVFFAGPMTLQAELAPSFMFAITTADGPGTVSEDVSSFTVESQTQVPGKTLKPGDYTIRIVDHLSDRMIVRIDRNGKEETTFLALPVSGLQKGAGQGPIRLAGGKGRSALRGFSFPNGTLAEFVFPKDEAVDIAKANNTKIPAVDPASEGMSATSKLSSTDMKMVTLWMLSPQTVGPDGGGKGIAAERYQAPRPAVTASADGAPLAKPTLPTQSRQQVAVTQIAPRHKVRPLMTALPHTAGSDPVILLTGLFSLAFAAALTLRRRSAGC